MATRVMATAALLLLAVCALAVEGQTKSFPVMFKDFMDAKNGKAKIASEHSYGYEQSELQGVCLRMLTQDACADEDDGVSKGKGKGDDDIHKYFETDVGCCSEGYSPKHQDVFRLPEDLKVGKCWWTFLSVGYDRVDAGVKMVGTYEVTCEMEEESEKCGEPLCDDLILHGWGRVYIDWKAAIEGKPSINKDYFCKNEGPVRITPSSGESAQPSTPAAKANPAKVSSADNYYEKDQPEYWKGMAVIADGYVNVMSCSKKTLYKEGKMQAVVDYRIYGDRNNYRGDPHITVPVTTTPQEAKPITPSPDQFVAKPFQIDFIMRRTGDV